MAERIEEQLIKPEKTGLPRPEEKSAIILIPFAYLAVFVGFLLPWINSPLVNVSGFQVALLQSSGYGQSLWLIPICSLIMFGASLSGRVYAAGAFLTGVMPVAAFVYFLTTDGQPLLASMAPGLIICVCAGIVLIVVALRQKGKALSAANVCP
jgi:hypothetical protein